MRTTRIAAPFLALLLLCGCGYRRFYITSEPPGATVKIYGKVYGETPCDANVPKKDIPKGESRLDVLLTLPDGREYTRIIDLYEPSNFGKDTGMVFSAPFFASSFVCFAAANSTSDEDSELQLQGYGLGLALIGLGVWEGMLGIDRFLGCRRSVHIDISPKGTAGSAEPSPEKKPYKAIIEGLSEKEKEKRRERITLLAKDPDIKSKAGHLEKGMIDKEISEIMGPPARQEKDTWVYVLKRFVGRRIVKEDTLRVTFTDGIVTSLQWTYATRAREKKKPGV